jgi:hypothetical protein
VARPAQRYEIVESVCVFWVVERSNRCLAMNVETDTSRFLMFFGGNSALRTLVSVSFKGFSSLFRPVCPIVGFVTTFPSVMKLTWL